MNLYLSQSWNIHNVNVSGNLITADDYCIYVNKVKQNLKSMTTVEAVDNALTYAINENLLNGYFKLQKMEVLNMSLTEFDQEAYDRHRRREGFEEGVEKAKYETARNALEQGLDHALIAKITGLSIENVQALAANMTVMV